MAKPKTRGKRRGGRNRQFFEGLSGLQRGLDAAIDQNTRPPDVPDPSLEQERIQAAEEKRKRKAYVRLKAAGLLKEKIQ